MTRHRPLPLAVRAQLFHHLAAMEKAGLPPDRSYALIDLGPRWRSRAQAFQRFVARGVAPPAAGAGSGLFTQFEARLLRAAFAGGSPYATYQRLADALAIAARQASSARARLAMPLLTLFLALAVGPLPQLFLGNISFGAYLWSVMAPMIVLGLAAAAVVQLHAWFTSGEEGPARDTLDRILLALPLFGKLHLRKTCRDFFESLALLLQAGLPMFEALPVADATVNNHIVRADLESLLPAVNAGATLSQAVATLRLVDTVQLSAFVHTGEQSGTLAEMLMRHADGETEALQRIEKDVMDWLPRVFYAFVALWMIWQLLGSKLPGAGDVLAQAVAQLHA